jgi:hypothetical protein
MPRHSFPTRRSSDLLPAIAFSKLVYIKGNISKTVNISGSQPANPGTFQLESVPNYVTYNFYGVEITPKVSRALAQMISNVVQLNPYNYGSYTTAVVPATAAVTGVDLTEHPGKIINHKSGLIIGLRDNNHDDVSGATVTADVPTTVKTTKDSSGSKYVDLAASGGSPVVFTVVAPALPSGDTYVANGATGIASSSAPTVNLYTITNSTFSGAGTATQFDLSVNSGDTARVTKL